jgi:hypothetical protein
MLRIILGIQGAGKAFCVRWRPGGGGLSAAGPTLAYAELSAKGITFLQEPSERPYGIEAVMRDNTGNWLVLVEPRPFTPEDFS